MPRKRASKTAKKALHKRFKLFCKLCLKPVRKTVKKLKRGRIVPKLNLSNLGFVAGLMVLILIGLSLYSVRVGRTQPPSLGFLPNNFTASLVLDINKLEPVVLEKIEESNDCTFESTSNTILVAPSVMTVEDLIYSNLVSAPQGTVMMYLSVGSDAATDEFGRRKIADNYKYYRVSSAIDSAVPQFAVDVIGMNTLLAAGDILYLTFSADANVCVVDDSVANLKNINAEGFYVTYAKGAIEDLLADKFKDGEGFDDLKIVSAYQTTLINSVEVLDLSADLEENLYWLYFANELSKSDIDSIVAADVDLDGVSNEDDKCDSKADGFGATAADATVDADGCSDAQKSEDLDNDGIHDTNDDDIDGDGVPNENDVNDKDPDITIDSDGDGIADEEDTDIDDDGVLNDTDKCDNEEDGFGATAADAAVDSKGCSDAQKSEDLDNDGIHDTLDPDIDGDDVANGVDLDPEDSSVGADSDGDGIADDADNCRTVANPAGADGSQADFDNDDIGDACDPDVDGDDVNELNAQGEVLDNCPLLANPVEANGLQLDTDEDGRGDACDNDKDGDNIANAEDECPLLAGVALVGGCPDSDSDGISDVARGNIPADNCPTVANADQVDSNGDGTGDACEADSDNDGIADVNDNCPLEDNLNQVNLDGDEFGDACDNDDDNDGRPDATDNCPRLANPTQSNHDDDGQGDLCDADMDNDGVADFSGLKRVDLCPFTSVAAGGNSATKVTNYGCLDEDEDGAFEIANSVASGGFDSDGHILYAELLANGDIKVDNCPSVSNRDQADNDNDGDGDVCDNDDDNDGLLDTAELGRDNNSTDPFDADTDGDGFLDGPKNEVDESDELVPDYCPLIVTLENIDTDGDGFGDACDEDDDDDGVNDVDQNGEQHDNCPLVKNVNQADVDRDGIGDVCDPLIDSDGDGIGHDSDNCIDVYNPDQADGYSPASDGVGPTDSSDGIGDVCQNVDGDVYPEGHSKDGQEILDAEDNCPLVANPDQFDMDGDDIGDACDDDVDGDDVLDVEDNCPLVRNPDQLNEDVDAQGDACDGGFNVSMTQSVEDLVCPSGSPVTEFQILSGEITMKLDEDFNPATINSDSVSVAVNQFELGVSDETTNNLGANNNTYDLILEIGESEIEGVYNDVDGKFTFDMSNADGLDFEFSVLDDDGQLIYERTLAYEIIFKPKVTRLNGINWVLDARDRLNFDELEVFFESNTEDFVVQASETFEINEAVEVDDVFEFRRQLENIICRYVEPEVVEFEVTGLEKADSEPDFSCEKDTPLFVVEYGATLNYEYPNPVQVDYDATFNVLNLNEDNLNLEFGENETVVRSLGSFNFKKSFDKTLSLFFGANQLEVDGGVVEVSISPRSNSNVKIESTQFTFQDELGMHEVDINTFDMRVDSNSCEIIRLETVEPTNIQLQAGCDLATEINGQHFIKLFEIPFGSFREVDLKIELNNLILNETNQIYLYGVNGDVEISRTAVVRNPEDGILFEDVPRFNGDLGVYVPLLRLNPSFENLNMLLPVDVGVEIGDQSLDLTSMLIDFNNDCYEVTDMDFDFLVNAPDERPVNRSWPSLWGFEFIYGDGVNPHHIFLNESNKPVAIRSNIDTFFTINRDTKKIYNFAGKQTRFIQPKDIEETNLDLNLMTRGECFGARYKLLTLTMQEGVTADRLYIDTNFNLMSNDQNIFPENEVVLGPKNNDNERTLFYEPKVSDYTFFGTSLSQGFPTNTSAKAHAFYSSAGSRLWEVFPRYKLNNTNIAPFNFNFINFLVLSRSPQNSTDMPLCYDEFELMRYPSISEYATRIYVDDYTFVKSLYLDSSSRFKTYNANSERDNMLIRTTDVTNQAYSCIQNEFLRSINGEVKGYVPLNTFVSADLSGNTNLRKLIYLDTQRNLSNLCPE